MTSILCLIIDSFADSQMIEALKMLATDSMTDPKVKKKLVSVLGAWHSQFKDDPSMSHISHLYNIVKPSTPVRRAAPAPPQPVYNRPEDDFTFDVDERNSREEIRRIQEEDRKEEKRKARKEKKRAVGGLGASTLRGEDSVLGGRSVGPHVRLTTPNKQKGQGAGAGRLAYPVREAWCGCG